VGFLVLAALGWAAGGFTRPVRWRTVLGSVGLMLIMGLLVFAVPGSRTVLIAINDAVVALLTAGGEGSLFLFGPLAVGPGSSTPAGEPSVGFVLAAQVLPAVVFFAALMAASYHLGIVQPIVRLLARLFHRTLGLSGAESLAGSSNVFVGVESAMAVRPYLASMTRSELLTLMTCGMSTVAATTLALYVLFLQDTFPLIAGHLVSASVMSIPAAAMVSKLILPEMDQPVTLGVVPQGQVADPQPNTLAALMTGSSDGLRMAAGIAALLIAVLGVVALVDLALTTLTSPLAGVLDGPVDLSRILGWLFMPLAWLLGIEGADLPAAARILGARTVLTEVVAYQQLAEIASNQAVSARTIVILSYALCGFAHLASVGIFVGGISALAPDRRTDLAVLGPKALIGATLATLMTGALAGMFYWGQESLLGL
jgi:CNT family concentrative nucleoside transporter